MLRILQSLIFIISIFGVAGCTDDASNTDNVKVVATSLDGKYKATVQGDIKTDKLMVIIENTEEDRELLNTVISIPAGYHKPIISMSWKNTKILNITLDHDFGEGKILYLYTAGDNELKLLD